MTIKCKQVHVVSALTFAKVAHRNVGQLRKYTGEPYIVHPIEVASIVRSVPHTNEMLMAAFLHDVVEDTGIPIEAIEENFGKEVSQLVSELTDVSKPSDGNRAARKAIDLAHTALASPAAKTIKLADLISNTSSIVKHDKAFASIYLAEKALLLEVLKEGDETLWKRAKFLWDDGMQTLAGNHKVEVQA